MMFFNPDPPSQYPVPVFPSDTPSAPAKASALRSHLGHATVELHKLHIALAIILATRERVLSRIQRCRNALASYRKLPTELIREIIKLQRASFPLEAGVNDPHLQITQICSSWRNIAFSMPTLWDLAFGPGYLRTSSIKLAKAWVGRSSAQGFSIAIYGNMPILPSPSFRTEVILQPETVFNDVVGPNSRRLRSLKLMPLNSFKWDLIRSRLSFDNLTTLILILHPGFYARDGELLSAPSLRSVCVFVYDPTNFVPGLPWAQLTNLSIDGNYPAHKVFSILAQCTSLEVFGLHANIEDTTSLPVSGISLPHLKSLSLSPGFLSTLDFLLLLKLPSLSTMEINAFPPSGQRSAAALTNIILSVAKTLRRFEVLLAKLGFLVDENIIAALSPVTHLSLPLAHRLSPSTVSNIGSGAMFPNLEYLEFGLSEEEDVQV